MSISKSATNVDVLLEMKVDSKGRFVTIFANEFNLLLNIFSIYNFTFWRLLKTRPGSSPFFQTAQIRQKGNMSKSDNYSGFMFVKEKKAAVQSYLYHANGIYMNISKLVPVRLWIHELTLEYIINNKIFINGQGPVIQKY